MRRTLRILAVIVAGVGAAAQVSSPVAAAVGDIMTFAVRGADGLDGITAGADANLWFVSAHNDRIGRITPSGTITIFADPGGNISDPQRITAGPDGNLWFTNQGNDRIGRITQLADGHAKRADGDGSFPSDPAQSARPVHSRRLHSRPSSAIA